MITLRTRLHLLVKSRASPSCGSCSPSDGRAIEWEVIFTRTVLSCNSVIAWLHLGLSTHIASRTFKGGPRNAQTQYKSRRAFLVGSNWPARNMVPRKIWRGLVPCCHTQICASCNQLLQPAAKAGAAASVVVCEGFRCASMLTCFQISIGQGRQQHVLRCWQSACTRLQFCQHAVCM